jgi:non-heme chloroperoxidase
MTSETPEQLATARAIEAIALQVQQSLWGSGTHSSLDIVVPTPTTRRRTMAWNNSVSGLANTSRRKVLATTLLYAISLTVRSTSAAGKETKVSHLLTQRIDPMTSITTKDGVQIFYKDWGPKSAQPVVFHHGWPLSSDDWETQMLFFVGNGYRAIAHDRRGHGRSSQVSDGHDMDHYAADAAAVVEHLDLRNAIHVGHSTGGGEATRYVARYGKDRVAKLVLIGAVPPLMLKTNANPGGLPIEVFDGLRKQLAANRPQFYLDFASSPFYGYNRPGAKASQAVVWNWWRQGMMGSAKAHYDSIKAFSETDFSEDLRSITVPALVMHGDDDQIVPVADSAPLSTKLLRNSTLKIYKGLPHGMCTTHSDLVNAELLPFIAA